VNKLLQKISSFLRCTNMYGVQIDIDGAQIDEEAAAILHSATQAVKAILDRRAALDREGKKDTPLIVLAGETHSMPAHLVHHMLVLKGLAKSGEKVVFGYEEQYNVLSRPFFKFTDRQPDPAITQYLQAHDQDGTLALQYCSSFLGTSNADHSENILCRYLWRRRKIPVRFTDAAKSKDCFDPDDPSTAQSMQACLGKISTGIHVFA